MTKKLKRGDLKLQRSFKRVHEYISASYTGFYRAQGGLEQQIDMLCIDLGRECLAASLNNPKLGSTETSSEVTKDNGVVEMVLTEEEATNRSLAEAFAESSAITATYRAGAIALMENMEANCKRMWQLEDGLKKDLNPVFLMIAGVGYPLTISLKRHTIRLANAFPNKGWHEIFNLMTGQAWQFTRRPGADAQSFTQVNEVFPETTKQ